MGAAKHIKQAMIDKGIKPGTVAASVGSMPQTFYNKLSRDSLRFDDVEKIADVLGCDVVLQDRVTGKTY